MCVWTCSLTWPAPLPPSPVTPPKGAAHFQRPFGRRAAARVPAVGHSPQRPPVTAMGWEVGRQPVHVAGPPGHSDTRAKQESTSSRRRSLPGWGVEAAAHYRFPPSPPMGVSSHPPPRFLRGLPQPPRPVASLAPPPDVHCPDGEASRKESAGVSLLRRSSGWLRGLSPASL